jgi:hypothetical protein
MRKTMMVLMAFVLVGGRGNLAGAGRLASGLQPGEDVESWNPVHVAGPDRGTTLCPVCTYLERPAVVVFTKDGPDAAHLTKCLEKLATRYEKHQLKGFVTVVDAAPARLKEMAERLKIVRVDVCYPAVDSRAKDLKAYKINPQARNTLMIYKDFKVVATFVDLAGEDFARVEEVVRRMLEATTHE